MNKPTAASWSRSSSRVTVMERSQVYFLFIVSWIFLIFSSASFTSEKNWIKRKVDHLSCSGLKHIKNLQKGTDLVTAS